MSADAEKDPLRKQIHERMNFKETDELLEIWSKRGREEWTETAFDVVHEILLERLGEIPPQDEKQADRIVDLGNQDISRSKKNLSNILSSKTRFHNAITWLLITVMFFLRVILEGVVLTLVKDSQVWIIPTFDIGNYLLIALLVWWERKHLAEFFIDRLALVILIFGKPYELLLHWLQIPIQYSPQTGFYLLYLPIALSMLIVVLVSRSRLPIIQAKNWWWLIIGATAGLVIGLVTGYLLRFQASANATVTPQLLFFLPTLQLVNSGIAEEPFFRGFLWGGLRRSGWKDIWILLFQIALFMLGHLYYINSAPLSFWVVVPIGGLVLGLLAWKSRSIATSMTAHGFLNSFAQLATYYRF